MICQPAGLTIADQRRLALGLGVQFGDDADEFHLGAADILDGLARHRFGQEADEIAGMARLQGDADFAVMFHAANARTMARARIKDDEGAFFRVDHHALGRGDADQQVIHRAGEIAAIADQFGLEAQDIGGKAVDAVLIIIAALAQDIEEKHRTLHGVLHIFKPGVCGPDV